jgi:hypothetical protein
MKFRNKHATTRRKKSLFPSQKNGRHGAPVSSMTQLGASFLASGTAAQDLMALCLRVFSFAK